MNTFLVLLIVLLAPGGVWFGLAVFGRWLQHRLNREGKAENGRTETQLSEEDEN